MSPSRYALGVGLRRRRTLREEASAAEEIQDREAKIFVDVTAHALKISPDVVREILPIASLRDVIDVVHRSHRLGPIFSSMGPFGAVMDACHAEANLDKVIARARRSRSR